MNENEFSLLEFNSTPPHVKFLMELDSISIKAPIGLIRDVK